MAKIIPLLGGDTIIPLLGGVRGGSLGREISVNILRITDLPTPESPPRRGLRGGYCEGGFGVKTNALIHPTHNCYSLS